MRSLPSSAPSTRRAERGQVIVIFAGGIVLFMLLLAVVLDVSWYWANTLRVQRAADAAALAGAVYLPGNRTTAYLRRPCGGPEERIHRRGRHDGHACPGQPGPELDDSQPATAQRHECIPPRSNTYFMRVIGISTVQATRASKAEYVLPVPMGSPQNYYGVGCFQGVAPARTETFAGSTDFVRPFAAPTPTNLDDPGLCLRRRRDAHRPLRDASHGPRQHQRHAAGLRRLPHLDPSRRDRHGDRGPHAGVLQRHLGLPHPGRPQFRERGDPTTRVGRRRSER